jgi:uncharacterized membrane protein YdjX (TVP38/TMEM64 family)
MNFVTLLRYSLIAILVCGLVTASIFAPRELQANLLEMQQFVHQHKQWAILAFFGLYIISMLLVFCPVAILTLLGGFLFGPILGGFCNLFGSLLCAVLAFLASRYFISEWVAERAGVKLNLLIEGVTKEGWRFIALIRLIPVLPFHLLNAALGLTKIRLGEYTLATFIFIMPVKLTYTYIGSLGENFVRNPEQISIGKLIFAVSLMVGVGFLPWIFKKFRSPKI